MLDIKKTEEYWKEQTKKGDNPCHYHNKWQDKYAFCVRTKAFTKKDFEGVRNIVDIGCGVGDYTNALSKLTEASFVAFDFPFNIEIAKKKYANNSKITFIASSLPDKEVLQAIEKADVIITTTVYVHLALPVREIFLDTLEKIKSGAKVILLEYAPDKIPSFQQDLVHKKIETPVEIVSKFKSRGFELIEKRHVNFVDSFFFHHLGKNFFVYWLTLFTESLLRTIGYGKSKYKLLIFKKDE